MRRILIFIGLKVAEIGGIVSLLIVPYWLSRFLCRWEWWRSEVLLGGSEYIFEVPTGIYWVTGSLLITLPPFVGYLLYQFIKWNWKKAGEFDAKI